MNNNIKTAELVISGDQYTGSVLRLISPVVLNTDPSYKTRLFGIIQSTNNKLFKIIEEIINFVKKVDFETKDQMQHKFINFPTPQLAVESQLETVLQNINTKLEATLNEKEINSIISNTNIILCLQNDDALSLASNGEIQVNIVRPRQIENELDKNCSYEVINLLKQYEEVGQNSNEKKLFSYFLSGKINQGDVVTLSTKNLWERIAEENLIRGIAMLPPASAIEFIKNNLSKWHGGSATAVLLQYKPPMLQQIQKQSMKRRGLGHAFQNSIENLLCTEKKTKKILSTPSLFKKSISSFFSLSNSNKKTKLSYQSRGLERKLRKFFDKLIFIIKFLIIFLFKIFKRLIFLIKNKDKIQDVIKETRADFNKGRNGLIKWFNVLPKQSRILLIISIFFIFIFTQSIFIFNIKQSYEKKAEIYKNTVEEIKKTTEEVGASLIYGDEKRAEQLLEKAKALLSNLSQKTKKEKNEALYLKEVINEKWTKLNHVINIPEPRLIADLGNTGGEFLIEASQSIYILNPNNGSVLKMDPDSGQINPHIIYDNINQLLSFWIQKDDQNVIIFKKNYLPDELEIQITSAEDILLNQKNIKAIDCSQIKERIKDLKIFNDKLYTLDTTQNQIWKHTKTASGFTVAAPWLKDNSINLKNTIALAIDGSMYVLENNGVLSKFYAGKNTDFKARISNKTENNTNIDRAKIWTSTEAKFIYILDKTNNRVVVFDKNGKLAAQYFSPIFTNLKDFAIQEREHKIYVLNDTQIYGIIASHVDFK